MLIKGLYEIEQLKQEDHTVHATIKLNKDHEVFKGHFPGNPILPGVCTIQIIKELTEKAFSKKLFLSMVSNVKFMAIINPENKETLQFKLDFSEVENQIKVKSTVSLDETLALKLNASFKQMN